MKLLLLLAAATVCLAKDYTGYHVLIVGPFKAQHEARLAKSVSELFQRTRKIVLWREPVGLNSFDMAVAPDIAPQVLKYLKHVPVQVATTNVQEWIDEEARVNKEQKEKEKAQYGDNVPLEAPERYMGFDEIVTWTNGIAGQHANARVENVGLTFENRQIIALKIGPNDGSKPKIWIDCGIHAREWISPATCLRIISRMLNNYGSDADSRFMVDTFDWIWIPVANPDGYEYSHDIFGDRMWRKTRSTTSSAFCPGADPNRNWDARWGTNGISFDPCSEIYCGAVAWSEPSVNALRLYAEANRQNMVAFVTVHSFTQLWLTPYAWQSGEYPSNDREIMALGNSICDSIGRVNGRFFEAGSPPDLLNEASGSSMDWAKFGNIRWTYAPELRPATSMEGGFIIPAVPNIRESGDEIFAGFATMARGM